MFWASALREFRATAFSKAARAAGKSPRRIAAMPVSYAFDLPSFCFVAAAVLQVMARAAIARTIRQADNREECIVIEKIAALPRNALIPPIQRHDSFNPLQDLARLLRIIPGAAVSG
jgi:hypothetical protein